MPIRLSQPNNQSTNSRKHLDGLIIRMFKVRGKTEMGLVLVACAIGKLYLAVNRFLV